ncbi:(R)-citramalate synthase [Candidatus Magnetaquicoccaceae bacterium FCR-1]|uniref:Citramalate synthase n=2 Tax=Candidatus Magnetaquiglobus chichijimensis TaxID=3141448 RepID=A0ABQ0CBB1_9PROT
MSESDPHQSGRGRVTAPARPSGKGGGKGVGEMIAIYDTTLRDGSQSESVQFSVEDKLRIARRLDLLGVDYIEGGWPGANPKDEAFFARAKDLKLERSRLVAFGSTRRAKVKAEDDTVLNALLAAGTGVITIFGKSWPLHVTRALGIAPAENLELIFDSIRHLKARTDQVFFDAEHFFDGFKADPDYAVKALMAARDGGADGLILCDTNGGSLPGEIAAIMRQIALPDVRLGIHCHNDGGLAVANTLAAVECGATQVQGTINGLGERCGNADLTTVVANLLLKMGRHARLGVEGLPRLTGVSRFVDEMCNRSPQKNQPFVGASAFAHKAGVHVAAILKDPVTYEHIDPEQVGNERRILVSEQAGRSNLVHKFREMGILDVDPNDPRLQDLLNELKELEFRGYQFDAAEASFELRVRKALGQLPEYFLEQGFRVIDNRMVRDDGAWIMGAEATVKLVVGGQPVHFVGEGNGPVDALYTVLRRALEWHYPAINTVTLVDYKVRILPQALGGRSGTGSMVRVLIEWRDEERSWGTVGVSEHIIAASYAAIMDALIFKLYKDGATPAV